MKKSLLKRCLKISYELENPERCRHFSFLIKKNHIVSIGFNQSWKTSPASKLFGHRFESLHSEVHCIGNLNTKGCTLVNVRLDRQNKIRNSKPCSFCQNMLNQYSLPCIYSLEDGWGIYESLKGKLK